MYDLFDKINQRTYFDKTKLFNHKIKEIIKQMDDNMEKCELIWGKNVQKLIKNYLLIK